MKRAGASVFGVAALLLSACSGRLPPPASPEDLRAVADYRLGVGDKLRITVFNEPTLTGEYAVGSNGTVAFPLIGDVRASDLTPTQLHDTIRAGLAAGYVNDPRVSVEVLNYRPYYILGEVTKPGEYPYVVGLTVQQAVATAGGFTYRAQTKRYFIKRANAPAERTFEVDLGTPVAVRPGDTIRIGERHF